MVAQGVQEHLLGTREVLRPEEARNRALKSAQLLVGRKSEGGCSHRLTFWPPGLKPRASINMRQSQKNRYDDAIAYMTENAHS
jgi:hypothetical protein